MIAEEVLNNLLDLYHEQKMAHAYLFDTNDLPSALEDLKTMIKKMSCAKVYQSHCHACNICNLIDNNNLPSLLIINPEGNTIKKEAVESIKNTFVMKPVYLNFNIYIIVEPELMNDTAYNRMLKFIEEPESDIIGFFLTQNKDKLPETIISRLEVIKLRYNNHDEVNNEKIETLLNEYLDIINNRKDDIIWYNTNVILKECPDKTTIILFFKRLLSYYQDLYRKTKASCDNKICKLIIAYLERLTYNVNISLLLDSFAIEMEQLYEK